MAGWDNRAVVSVLTTGMHQSILRELEDICPEALRHQVAFPPARPGHKIIGSGLFVINPPFTLAPEAARLIRCFKKYQSQQPGETK